MGIGAESQRNAFDMSQPEDLHIGIGFAAVLVPAGGVDFDSGLSFIRGFEKRVLTGGAVTGGTEIEFFG